MNGKKALALVAKNIREIGGFGQMTPNLDNDFAPQVMIASGKFNEIQYLVRVEDLVLGLYVFRNNGEWKVVLKKEYDSIGSGFLEEHSVIAGVVMSVQKLLKES